MRHGAGALQGDSVVYELFACPYEPQAQSWLEETKDERLGVQCSLTGDAYDVSCCIDVDDLFRIVILDRINAAAAVRTTMTNDPELDRRLAAIST